jgi:DinB superfamily
MSERCAECDFDWGTSTLEGLRIIDQLPTNARELAKNMGEAAYRSTEPKVWSANEYVWHLVDAFRMAAEWVHDIRVREHPTHYAVDSDALASVRQYEHLPIEVGLWSLEQSCGSFIAESAITDLDRTCYYHDWQDVTAAQVVGFLVHEAVHHLHDLRRMGAAQEVGSAS